MDLTQNSVAELGRLYRRILAEMRDRGVIRTWNAPIGDYAEWLVAEATGGELAPNSQKSWDIRLPDGERLQVKSRFVTSPEDRGQRRLSSFRSWDFEAAVIVLFDDDFQVWRAVKLDLSTLKENAKYVEHVSGNTVMATNDLLAQGRDMTDELRQTAEESS